MSMCSTTIKYVFYILLSPFVTIILNTLFRQTIYNFVWNFKKINSVTGWPKTYLCTWSTSLSFTSLTTFMDIFVVYYSKIEFNDSICNWKIIHYDHVVVSVNLSLFYYEYKIWYVFLFEIYLVLIFTFLFLFWYLYDLLLYVFKEQLEWDSFLIDWY